MRQHAANEVIAQGAELDSVSGIVEQIALARVIPQTEMDVGAIAGLIGKRFGRQRGEESMPMRHAAHGIAKGQLIVGSAQTRGVTYGEFLLSRAQFRVVLLYL